MLQAFSKCGVIKEDDQRRPRIKIYRDRASGMPKGDGLVTYLKDPSVSIKHQQDVLPVGLSTSGVGLCNMHKPTLAHCLSHWTTRSCKASFPAFCLSEPGIL